MLRLIRSVHIFYHTILTFDNLWGFGSRMICDFSQLANAMIYIMYSLFYSQVCILILTLTVEWENKGKHSAMVSPL